MKKLTIAALVIGVALMLAVPAGAVDIAWDGYLRVRGFLEQNGPMADNTGGRDQGSYNAYYDMRWRTNWTLTINDYLRIRSRWRALNQNGGTPASGDENNFQFERAWMLVQTPYGLFEAGRMITQTFGTSFLDNETDVFRLNYSTKIADKVVFVATVQKPNEGDGGDNNPAVRWNMGDNDVDVYAFALVYPTENWSIGSLQVLLRNSQPDTGNITRYSADPYFIGKFGNLALQAEGQFYAGDGTDTAAGKDQKYKAYAFNAEGTYDLGMASVQLGFAYCSGDNDPTDGDIENLPLGSDWEKFYILFGTTGNLYEDLAGIGNFATSGNTAGFTTVYGGVSTNLTEQLNVGLSAAWAKANEPQKDSVTGNEYDDSAGVEVDLRINWTFYDNLTYSVIGSYLFAGDYWQDASKDPANNGVEGNDDNPWALFHAIQLNF